MLFGGRRHPAHIDAVDADAVAEMRVGDISGQCRQRGLGRGIDGEFRRTAMRVDRQDVDDAARRAARLHVRHRGLHQEERGARVDGKQPVPILQRSGQQRCAVGKGGGIDQAIDTAELCDRRRHDGGGRVRFAKVGANEGDGAAGRVSCTADGLATLGIAADDRDGCRAARGGKCGDRRAQPLRSAGDHKRLAFKTNDQRIAPQVEALRPDRKCRKLDERRHSIGKHCEVKWAHARLDALMTTLSLGALSELRARPPRRRAANYAALHNPLGMRKMRHDVEVARHPGHRRKPHPRRDHRGGICARPGMSA